MSGRNESGEAVHGQGQPRAGGEFDFGHSDLDLDLDLDPGDLDAAARSGTQARSDAMAEPAFVEPASGLASEGARADADDEIPSKNKSKTNLIIIGVVLVMLVMLGGLLYVGYQMFMTPKGHAGDRPDYGRPQLEVQQPSEGRTGNTALNTATEIADAFSDLSEPGQKADPLIVVDALAGAGQEVDGSGSSTLLPPGGADANEAGTASSVQQTQIPVPTTEEDAMYDNLLSQASKLDVPNGAIKIDSSVVSQTLAARRLEALEVDVGSAHKDVEEMKQAVQTLQSQVSQISSTVSASQANNEKLIGAIEALTKDVADSSKRHEAELAALNKKVEGVSAEAKKAVGAQAAAKVQAVTSAQVVAAPRPAVPVQQVAQQQQSASTRAPTQALAAPKPTVAASPSPAVTLPKPLEVRSVTAPVMVERPNVPTQCDGRFVSSNWRVKGINDTSAYVVRVQDGASLLVRSGMQIPGFGEVQSFDRTNRAICTTQGLVRR